MNFKNLMKFSCSFFKEKEKKRKEKYLHDRIARKYFYIWRIICSKNERVKFAKGMYESEGYLVLQPCSTWTCFSSVAKKKFNEMGETWKYQIKSRLN